jgi:choline monooxygenase
MQLTLPTRLYRDPAQYEAERRSVFAAGWQFLGREADMPRAGDYLAEEIAGYPLLAVRDAQGGLNGFHNVCRHRAGPLVDDGAGSCGQELTCRYHGWRYTLDGRLRNATGFGVLEGFDPREFGLHPAAVQTWRGFVFVNPDAKAPPLAELVAPLEALFEARDIRLAPAVTRRSHEIACNWKTYVENYLEGYHIGPIHPELAAEIEVADYQVTMHGEVAIHDVPTKSGANNGLWAWLWPNLAINVFRYGLMVEHMQPLGPDRTRLDYLYFHEAGDDMAAILEASDQLTGQDRDICEAVQRNLNAGVYQTGVLSPRHEGAVGWFQNRIAELTT